MGRPRRARSQQQSPSHPRPSPTPSASVTSPIKWNEGDGAFSQGCGRVKVAERWVGGHRLSRGSQQASGRQALLLNLSVTVTPSLVLRYQEACLWEEQGL